MSQVNTSHFDIFDYWKGKIIQRNGNITTDVSADGVEVITDWGEPCCWGCGKPIIGQYEKNLLKGEDIDFKKLWNDKYVKSKLNRCHIIPGALGGEDKPANLFLLCESCHIQSPDTTSPRSFYRWVYYQRREKMYMGELSPMYVRERVREELDRRGLPGMEYLVSEIVKRGYSITADDVLGYILKHVGSHGMCTVESSRICAIADCFQKKYLDVCLE